MVLHNRQLRFVRYATATLLQRLACESLVVPGFMSVCQLRGQLAFTMEFDFVVAFIICMLLARSI